MTTKIIFEEVKGEKGNLGLITLNRPAALNALDKEMFDALDERLQMWQNSSTIKAVVIKAIEGRAFSAGGDIRAIYNAKMANDTHFSELFYQEYKVNKFIFHYLKPYIAFLDGITMGGGAGVSLHGSLRIGTERLVFAMPETTIGFFPDIGASYFLSRLAHHVGMYLGLTGEKIAYNDCYALGLVDTIIDRHSIEAVIQALAKTVFVEHDDVARIVSQWKIDVPASHLLEHQIEIQNCFSKNSVEEIIVALETFGTEWCTKTAAILNKKSPTSLKVTFEAITKAQQLDFDACMQMETQIMQHMLVGHDFFEGIRAVIIDKDQSPKWQPALLTEVSEQDVQGYFEP